MSNIKYLILLIALSSCGFYLNVNGNNFEAFVNTVKTTAGNDAKDCGLVEIYASQLNANTCVANAFSQQIPFYAIYKLQGIDSSLATAIVSGTDHILYFIFFDSDPSGGGNMNNGKITTTECKNAKYLGKPNVPYSDLFSCN